jgi:hypothetical protein
MNICTSCKNIRTTDRCRSKCIKGLDVCGTHAKSKTRRNWYIINRVDSKLSKIQAIWRGYELRNALKRAGPGVLKRSICHNEEELVSLDPISKLHPLLYFAFEEGGKVWAFDINSIFNILIHNVVIQNPYTREPLSNDTRRRLRSYFFYLTRRKNRHSVQISRNDVVSCKLNLMTQVIHDNGFEDFKLEHISSLTSHQAFMMRSLIADDMRVLELTNKFIKFRRYYSFLKSRHFMPNSHPTLRLITILSIILVDIQHCPSAEYEICFLIMSALYRI